MFHGKKKASIRLTMAPPHTTVHIINGRRGDIVTYTESENVLHDRRDKTIEAAQITNRFLKQSTNMLKKGMHRQSRRLRLSRFWSIVTLK